MRRQTGSLGQHGFSGWRAAPAPALVALVVIASLLLAFYQVVSGAVRQGEERRHAAAAEADAAWRCNVHSATRQRMSCLTQLHSTSAEPPDAAEMELATLARAAR